MWGLNVVDITFCRWFLKLISEYCFMVTLDVYLINLKAFSNSTINSCRAAYDFKCSLGLGYVVPAF